ncbi:MAG: PucR family transcriptional regulator, partial [Jatrophihabitans sp.]
AADDLLPERAIAGDASAREQLIDTVYRPLTESGDAILDTVVAYLDSGRALEATARALFVHANTVRYRLRRAADLCGRAPTDARGAFTISLAMVLGRLAATAATAATADTAATAATADTAATGSSAGATIPGGVASPEGAGVAHTGTTPVGGIPALEPLTAPL